MGGPNPSLPRPPPLQPHSYGNDGHRNSHTPSVFVIEPSPTGEAAAPEAQELLGAGARGNWNSPNEAPPQESHAPEVPPVAAGSNSHISFPPTAVPGKKPPPRPLRINPPPRSVHVVAASPSVEDGLVETTTENTNTNTTSATAAPSETHAYARPAAIADAAQHTAQASTTASRAPTAPIGLAAPAPPAQAVSPAGSTASAIDPLSQHIILRTNTDRSLTQRLRLPNPPIPRPASPVLTTDTLIRPSAADGPDAGGSGRLLNPDVGKEKKKGVSFLSRLSMRSSKKKGGDADDEDGSEPGDQRRPEGSNATVFSTIVRGSGGYVPHHKEPPRYIRTKANHKKIREFNRMFLAQELVGTRPPKEEDAGVKSPVVTVTAGNNGGGGDGQLKPGTKTKTGGAIWATEFSRDGRFLAAAGRDQVVRVWAVISSADDRRAHREDEAAPGGSGERLSAPVFRDQPVREFHGHTGEVLDLSWSKNNFLLSTSMDRTVRLWHMSRQECLCTFKHKEIVSKVAFHPRDDRFFLAGCLDATLRLWSIPDKAVAFSAQTSDLITAVAFTPDGRVAIAGLLSGLCNFYETEGLKFQSQLHVRSSRGKNAKGSKITGIQTAEVLPPTFVTSPGLRRAGDDGTDSSGRDCDPANVKVLITSTDARVRIYNLRDKTLDVKFKGHEHACGQLCASFSDDGSYVVCPSEDRKAFIWSLGPAPGSGPSRPGLRGMPSESTLMSFSAGGVSVSSVVGGDSQKGDKAPCECFAAHGSMVTTAIFAPTRTRQLLGASGDPIYDLCNPPPVTLVSLSEAVAAAAAAGAGAGDAAAGTTNGNQTPSQPHYHNHIRSNNASQTELSEIQTVASKRAEESPAYIARSTHFDGNIIVTTDDAGLIKVFRQDCAFRRRHDGWDSTSTLGRKVVGRSGSLLTRTSASSVSHSRRGSLSLVGGGPASGPPSVTGGGVSSDRILNWRQGIESSPNGRASIISNGGTFGTPVRGADRSERSISPTKSSGGVARAGTNLAGERRRELYVRNAGSGPAPASPASSTFSASNSRARERLRESGHYGSGGGGGGGEDNGFVPTEPPTPAFSFKNGDDLTSTGGAPRRDSNALSAVVRSDTATSASPTTTSPPNETTGFFNLKWPRMPALRTSIGSFAGLSSLGFALSGTKESGGDANDGGPGQDDNTNDSSAPADEAAAAAASGGGRRSSAAAPSPEKATTTAVPAPIAKLRWKTPSGLSDAAEDTQSSTTLSRSVDSDQEPHRRQRPQLSSSAGRLNGSPLRGGGGGGGSGTGRVSLLSRISNSLTSSDPSAAAGTEDEDEVLSACRACGGSEFKAKRMGGRQRFLCAGCGALVVDGSSPSSAGVGGGVAVSAPVPATASVR